jgi:arsenate reductase
MTDESHRGSTIIFLCVANSARSQMAEGLARAMAPPGWRVYSAGSSPAVTHPFAVEVLRESGVDIGDYRSKGFDEVPLKEADYVVTLCAEEVCPVVHSGAQQLHWPLPDPAGQGDMIRHQIDAFRNTRDEIRRRLNVFWAQHRA